MHHLMQQLLINHYGNKQLYLLISIRASHSKILSEVHEFLICLLFVKKRQNTRRKRINKTKEEIDEKIKGESMRLQLTTDDSNNYDDGPIHVPIYAPKDVPTYSSKLVLTSFADGYVVSAPYKNFFFFLTKKCQRGRLLEICLIIVLGKKIHHVFQLEKTKCHKGWCSIRCTKTACGTYHI